MNDRLHAIEYRRLVASVASHLSVEEVEHIKFIRLPELEGTHECDSEEKTSSALHILATLERKGEFSHQNIDGLTEIIKDVNRHDLMKQIESYKKTRMPAKKSGKSSKALKRKQLRSSEERKELEETYEMMVTRFTFLEQQMSLIPRLLEGEGDIQDEGTVILRSLKHTAEELATKLGQAHEYFGGHASETNSASESPKGDTRRGSSEDKKTNQDGSSSKHNIDVSYFIAHNCISHAHASLHPYIYTWLRYLCALKKV